MRNRIAFSAVLSIFLLFSACSAYVVPWLSLDVKTTPYEDSDIIINYTYECEDRDQYCIYNLYNVAYPSDAIHSESGIMSSTGVIDLSVLGLGEGDYRLDFSVYSEKDGEFSLLKYLDESYEFSIDFP